MLTLFAQKSNHTKEEWSGFVCLHLHKIVVIGVPAEDENEEPTSFRGREGILYLHQKDLIRRRSPRTWENEKGE